MKNARWLLFLALAGFWTLSLHAQVLVFSGHITSTTGILAGHFADGDPVSLSLDFTNSTDLSHGSISGVADYEASYEFSIAGEPLSLMPPQVPNLSVFLIKTSSQQGLFISEGFSPDGAPGVEGRYVNQSVLTPQDVGATRNIFPGGIPFDKFSSTAGTYRTTVLVAHAFLTTGEINWKMDSYVGALALPDLPDQPPPPPPPPPMNPVPEPSTYGLMGSLALFGMVARQIKRKRRAQAA